MLHPVWSFGFLYKLSPFLKEGIQEMELEGPTPSNAGFEMCEKPRHLFRAVRAVFPQRPLGAGPMGSVKLVGSILGSSSRASFWLFSLQQ